MAFYNKLKNYIKTYLFFQDLNSENDNIYAALNDLEARKVNKIAVSTLALANMIAQRNIDGKLAGDILGNAETVTDVTNLINGVSVADVFEAASSRVKEATKVTAQIGDLMIDDLLPLIDPLGHIKEYAGSVLPNRHLWVNGCTIGDESSNATGRANADTYNLFAVLWGSVNNADSQIKLYDADGNLVDKGADAAADFAAHYKISLPDKRGRTGIGLDNMGGVSADVVADIKADILGGYGGEEEHALTGNENGPHSHGIPSSRGEEENTTLIQHYTSLKQYQWIEINTLSSGSGTPHANMQPWVGCNYIMRY